MKATCGSVSKITNKFPPYNTGLMAPYPLYCTTQETELHGPQSKVVYYKGDRVPFGTHPKKPLPASHPQIYTHACVGWSLIIQSKAHLLVTSPVQTFKQQHSQGGDRAFLVVFSFVMKENEDSILSCCLPLLASLLKRYANELLQPFSFSSPC